MKASNWAAVTCVVIILTAAAMVGMGWFGSGRHSRASAANTAQICSTASIEKRGAVRRVSAISVNGVTTTMPMTSPTQ